MAQKVRSELEILLGWELPLADGNPATWTAVVRSPPRSKRQQGQTTGHFQWSAPEGQILYLLGTPQRAEYPLGDPLAFNRLPHDLLESA